MKKKQTHDTLLFLALFFFSDELVVARTTSTIGVNVGLVLDMNSWAGKMSSRCISMAFSDFYASHSHYKTRLVLHTRDSNNSVIGAAHAGGTSFSSSPFNIRNMIMVRGSPTDPWFKTLYCSVISLEINVT